MRKLLTSILQGWPSGAAIGQTSSNGADGAGFNSGASGQQAGYSMAHDSFGQAGGYPQQAAFGAFSPQQAAMATPQVDPPNCSLAVYINCSDAIIRIIG